MRDNHHERSRCRQNGQSARTDEHRLLAKGQIYADVWKFGINTALRISDLLAITVEDVRTLNPERPELRFIEGKTGKARILTINTGAQAVIDRRLSVCPEDMWLFQSQSHWDRRPAEQRGLVTVAAYPLPLDLRPPYQSVHHSTVPKKCSPPRSLL